MAKVAFYPSQKTIQVPEGTTILEAARMAGVIIESPCNAVGVCGKCKVKLDDDSLNNVKQSGNHHLSREEERLGYALSCETEIWGDITVEVEEVCHQNKTLKVLSHGESIDIELDRLVTKAFLPQENITMVYAGGEFIGSEQGDTENQIYGVVVDIGTTTLVTSLVNLNTGEELESSSALNPQSVHAQDVLSRITFASNEEGLEVMYSTVIEEINRMIAELSQNAGVAREYIYEVVFSGNTCMLHLATRVNPQSMGKYPYIPEIWGGNYLKAADFGLGISKFGLIYLPPVISAYVGADITSGILASGLRKLPGVTLFVDIGTNGEMVIGFDGRLSATSTAAGPAFEGMNITCGMRAGSGAIEHFNIDLDGNVSVRTIGNSLPVGICGSGLLDIVGELVANKIINKSGKLVSPDEEGFPLSISERLIKQDGKTVFTVTENVHLSQKDIRQVQLAKAAIRAGIEFLLQSKGITALEVDRVYIAGSFGYHLREKSLINIGLLPSEFEGKIEFIGNTSKSGGKAFLLNQSYRKDMEEMVKQIDILDLADSKDFDRVFVSCLNF